MKKINPINVSGGRIERYIDFKSKYFDTRIFDVWLPDDYDNNESYNLLIMNDGQLLFDKTYSWNQQEWCVDEWMIKLTKEKRIEKTIVVGIWNGGHNRHTDYFPKKPMDLIDQDKVEEIIRESKKIARFRLFNDGIKSDQYLEFIVKELVPFLEKNYSIKKKQNARFIGGSSMGGLISLYALCEYPHFFGGAICMSTHWPGDYPKDDNLLPDAIIKYVENNMPIPKTHKIYFDYGSEGLDSFYGEYQERINALFKSRGFDKTNFLSKYFPKHGHQEKFWAERLNIPLEFMLKGK